jgi:hypothetical protein
MNWKFWQKKKEEAPVFNTGEEQMEVAKVEPHFYFKDAMSKGIIAKEKLFTLNGKDYYTFADGLGMITAKRYLHYTSMVRFYEENGVNKDVSLDYLSEIEEKVEELSEYTYDDMVYKKKQTELVALISTFKYHYESFNIEGAMCEVCAVALITPSENPYDIDHSETAKKMYDFSIAINNRNGEDFASFFWRLSSIAEFKWTEQFLNLTASMASRSQSQESLNHARNLLILDIQKHSSLLDEMRLQKSFSKPAKAFRVLWGLTALNLRKPQSWITSLKS